MTSFKDIALKRRALRAINAPEVGERRLSARMMRGTDTPTPVDRGEWNSIRALRKASVVKTASNVAKKFLDDARDIEREGPYPAVSLDLDAGTLSIGEPVSGKAIRGVGGMDLNAVWEICSPNDNILPKPAYLHDLVSDVARAKCVGPILTSRASRQLIFRLIDASSSAELATWRGRGLGGLNCLIPLPPARHNHGHRGFEWVPSIDRYDILNRNLVQVRPVHAGIAPMTLSEAMLVVTWLETWVAEDIDHISTDGIATNFGPIYSCVESNPGLGRWIVGVCKNAQMTGAVADAEMKMRLIDTLVSKAAKGQDMRAFEQYAGRHGQVKARRNTRTSH